MSQFPITEADLQAYADDALPAGKRREVEAYLAARPVEMERVQAYREQTQALRELFDPVLTESIPERLLAFDRKADARGTEPFRWSFQRIAAGVALALVSGAAGWVAHAHWHQPELVARMSPALPAQDFQGASLAHQAAVAHVVFSPDVRRPVEIGAEQEDQLVAWLSKRLGSPIRPPKLGALGYELIGGRLLPGTSGPVAQFMYHDVTGQRLTLYVSTENTDNRDTGFRFAQEGPVNVFYWIDGKFGYALSAGKDKGELARIATAVYEELEHK